MNTLTLRAFTPWPLPALAPWGFARRGANAATHPTGRVRFYDGPRDVVWSFLPAAAVATSPMLPSPSPEPAHEQTSSQPIPGFTPPRPRAVDEDTAAWDRRLMAAAARGDHAAFAELYDRLAAPIFSLVLRMVGERAEAEDVFQEIFVRIWKRAPTYDGNQSSVFSWVVTIARGKAIDHLRARGRRRLTFTESVEENSAAGIASAAGAADTSDASLITQHKEEATLIRRLLTDLPVEQRESIELAFFSGLSHHEISDRLKQPLGTVKARIRRGMLRLRECLPGRGISGRTDESVHIAS